MAKKVCVCCQKEMGMLTPKVALADGVVCASCLKSAGISALGNAQARSSSDVAHLIADRTQLLASFSPTKTIGAYLQVDDTNRLFKVGADLFRYENLLDFELLEDGNTITKGGLGRAVAGGILFGGVGAVVGGITGGKKQKATCTSMKIRLTLKDAHTDTSYIVLIATETKHDGIVYKSSCTVAQQCIAALQIIADANQAAPSTAAAPATPSAADEIMKFKQLLDAGVITQDEFDSKKKQLLGL